MKRPVAIFTILAALTVLTGCNQLWTALVASHQANPEVEATTDVSTNPSDMSVENLSETLEAAGAEVEIGENITQVFFDVPGQIIRVNGEDVQVFEFADEAAAQNAASQISPDGSSTATTMITWIAPPHFYRAGSVIVLYVGDNENIQNLLESLLGPQFAGQ